MGRLWPIFLGHLASGTAWVQASAAGEPVTIEAEHRIFSRALSSKHSP